MINKPKVLGPLDHDKINKMYQEGYTISQLGKNFQIGPKIIARIVNKK